MQQTFFVYHETRDKVTVDIPDGASTEEIEDLVSEAYYNGKADPCYNGDIPEITDIETEDGEPLKNNKEDRDLD